MASQWRVTDPICLIEAYDDNKMYVNEEAQRILGKICQPLVVVSIVGPFQSGKSYLINKLSGGREGGFSVGHTIKTNTRGIWMWCVPHPRKHGHTLVLLDTEGLGGTKKGDKDNDCMILSLAMLMSSAVIYNSTANINLEDLEKLKFKLQRHYNTIHGGVQEKAQSQEEMEVPSNMAPFCVWVIRDFTVKSALRIQGTGDGYLEKCAHDASIKIQKVVKQTEICRTIRRHFPKQKVWFFGPPSRNKDVLRRLDQVPETDLEADFLSETLDFCNFVLEEAPAKKLREDRTMTGSAFAQLLGAYVDVVTSGDITYLERSVSNMSLEENRRAFRKSAALYEKNMEDERVSTEEEFRRRHKVSLGEALCEFQKNYVRHEIPQAVYLDRLKEDLQKKREELWKILERRSLKKCDDLIQRLMCAVDLALAQHKYHVPGGHDRFVKDRIHVVRTFNQEPNKGVKAGEVLNDFLVSLEEIENIVLQTDQAISANKPKKFKGVNPKDFTQLTQYISAYELPTGRFDRIQIQLCGFAGHGKSSFVNSCLFVLRNDHFQDRAGEGEKTMVGTAYQLTDTITIVDSRGFTKLGAPEASEIHSQLCNFAPLYEAVDWDKISSLTQKCEARKIPDLVVPVLVYSVDHVLSKEDVTRMKVFLKQAQELTGVLPFIVLTNHREESELGELFVQMGMENIYFVENYTMANHAAERKKHLVFLNFLADVLMCIDFHLQESVNFQRHEGRSFLMKMANQGLSDPD